MCRPILILGAFTVLFIATACSQQIKIIRPVYIPPPGPRNPIRKAREANHDPLRLNRNGDVIQLPTEQPIIYDDIKMDPTLRYARSLSTPGHGRASGSRNQGSKGHDTGAAHPGYNRRNAREVKEEQTERPIIYDDIKMDPAIRHARSLSTPGHGRMSGSSNQVSKGHDTGATHPGYNRRNAREVKEEQTERPTIYDDIKVNPAIRHARSLSTPARGRVSRSRNQGSTRPTYAGYDTSRRNAREVKEEPTEQPIIYDDSKIIDPTIRHARSLSTPGRGRMSGSSNQGSKGHDTGATHPGYNRRNTRSLNFPSLLPPFDNPRPWNPRFPMPTGRPRFPIYV